MLLVAAERLASIETKISTKKTRRGKDKKALFLASIRGRERRSGGGAEDATNIKLLIVLY